MKTTTLNRIRAHGPCKSGWTKLLATLGKTEADDEPLPFQVILDSNGWRDAVWCMRAEPQHQAEWRLFAVWCCRRVQHLRKDPRCIVAVDAAEAYAKGRISAEYLAAAGSAAYAYAAAAAATYAYAAATYADAADTADAAAAAAAAAAYDAAAAAAAYDTADTAAAYTQELSQIFSQEV